MLAKPTDSNQKVLFYVGLFMIFGGLALGGSAGLSASIAVHGSSSNHNLFTWLAIGSGTASLLFITVGNYFRMYALGKVGKQRHRANHPN